MNLHRSQTASRAALALCLAATLVLTACAEDEVGGEKGLESLVPAQDQKGDGFRAPTLHGALSFGESTSTSFVDDALFHAWDFSLAGAAEIALETTPVDPKVDTVLYLYRRDAGAQSWGAYVARNDDNGSSIGSKLEGAYQAGEYRVLVKGYSESVRGAFSLSSRCAGAGCTTPEQGELLSAEQAQIVLDAFDGICGDTFCGGDFNYRMLAVTCSGTGSCELRYGAKSYYEEDAWQPDVLAGHDLAALTVAGPLSGGSGTYTGSVVELTDEGADGVWMTLSCALDGGFHSVSDVIDDPNGGADAMSAELYNAFIDCSMALEQVLFAL